MLAITAAMPDPRRQPAGGGTEDLRPALGDANGMSERALS